MVDIYGSGRKSGDCQQPCPYVEGDKIEVLFRDHWHSGEFVCENEWGGLDVRYDDAKWDIARVSPKSVRQPEVLKKQRKRKETRVEVSHEKKMSVIIAPPTPLAVAAVISSQRGGSSSASVSQIPSSSSMRSRRGSQDAATPSVPIASPPALRSLAGSVPPTPGVMPVVGLAAEPVPIAGSLSLTEETVLKKRRSIIPDEAEEHLVMSLRFKVANDSKNAKKQSKACAIL